MDREQTFTLPFTDILLDILQISLLTLGQLGLQMAGVLGMCTDMCTWGWETRPAGAPDGGYIGACVLTCVLGGGTLGQLGLQMAGILGYVY